MLTTVYIDVPDTIFMFVSFYKFEIVSKSQVKLKRPNGKRGRIPFISDDTVYLEKPKRLSS